MKESTIEILFFTGLVIAMAFAITYGFNQIDKAEQKREEEQNKLIVDCTTRGNELSWCLNNFN